MKNGDSVKNVNVYISNSIEDISYLIKDNWVNTLLSGNIEDDKNSFLVKDTFGVSETSGSVIPLFYYLYSPNSISSISKGYVDK